MRAPAKFLLIVGALMGLCFVFGAPAWVAGADEWNHFARSLDITNGNLKPARVDGRALSPIPRSYREDQDTVILGEVVGRPITFSMLGDLLHSTPRWNDTVAYDTQTTMAASPVSYAPSAMAMVIPNWLGAPGIVVLWCGRLADLAVYLALAWFAVRVATAFRWAIVLTALLPINLAIAASVTCDAMTMGALLLVLGVWTRVWRPPTEGDAGDGPTADPAAAVDDTDPAAVPADVAGAVPATRPSTPFRARRDVQVLALLVGTAGLLSILSKPPYFMLLASLPALLVVRWRDTNLRVAAVVATVVMVLGLGLSFSAATGDYRSVTDSIGGKGIVYQPEVQKQTIADDPIGYVGRSISRAVEAIPEGVQKLSRRLGPYQSGLPTVVPWLILTVFIAAAMVLDRDDLLRLRRYSRLIFSIAAVAITFVIMTSEYIVADDTVEGIHVGDQLFRYVAPLFGLAVMGFAPRFVLRGRALSTGRPTWLPTVLLGAVAVAEVAAAVAILITWWGPGAAPTLT